MSEESTPYDAAISDLESRIQYFQTMLDGMKQLRSQITGAPMPSNPSRPANESEILHDSFFGMTIGDAAKKYLTMTKTTKSTSDIGAALERGGLKHSSKDFNTTVRSVLGGREDFLRVNGDWGLTEWYPGMRREKKAKQKPAEEKLAPNQTETQNAPSETNPKIKDKVLKLLASEPTKLFKAPEVAEKIAVGLPSTRAALSELFKANLLDRPVGGQYTAKKQQAA